MANEGTVTLTSDSIRGFHIKDSQIERVKSVLQDLQEFRIPLTALRVWDDLSSLLPSTPATDDLGIVTGTFGTSNPLVQTGDLKSAGATTRYARFLCALPERYVADEDVRIRVHAGMADNAADTTATIDLEVYEIQDDDQISADLCATAAQSINSTTYADKDFTITDTALAPGSILDVRIAIAINDGAGASPVTGSLAQISLRCDVRP